MSPKSSTAILVSTLRILAKDIRSEDGIANATIAEAAERMAKMHRLLSTASNIVYYSSMKNAKKIWLEDAKKIGIEPCPF